MAILTMLVRRLLILVLGQKLINEFLGQELVDALLGDSTVSWIVSIVGTGGLLLWSMRDKLLQRLVVKAAIAAPPVSTINEIKEDVAAMPLSEKLQKAFERKGY
jgi:hypothetical protein